MNDSTNFTDKEPSFMINISQVNAAIDLPAYLKPTESSKIRSNSFKRPTVTKKVSNHSATT